MVAFKLVDEKKTVRKVQQVSYCRLWWEFFFNLMVLIQTKSAFILPYVVVTLWKHRWTGKTEDICVNISIFGFILKNLNIFFILVAQSP